MAIGCFDRFELLFDGHNSLLDFLPFAFKRWRSVHDDTELTAFGKQSNRVPKLVPCMFVDAGSKMVDDLSQIVGAANGSRRGQYPWLFGWDGLMTGGLNRFRDKIQRIRAGANELGDFLAREIHPGPSSIDARDFGLLLMAADYDPSFCVWVDSSHYWAGESWSARFNSPFVASRLVGSHAKNFKLFGGASTLIISEDWSRRGHPFCGHGQVEVNVVNYAKLHLSLGVADRFCAIADGKVMPMNSAAEDSIFPLTAPSSHLWGACSGGVRWVNEDLSGMSLTSATSTDGMAK
ncbi:MAG: hypothetical protein JNL67_01005 [Planctomycetaceae bacterium]|nr:hypothetical protein [Planctomycetaceae bacterium]